MILLTDDSRAQLRANAGAQRDAQRHGRRAPDPAPVVKFFNPVGAATWLATEIDADGDTLFGLADLGFGCPECGSFSLAEIASIRLPFGLGIERDLLFETVQPLSVWAETARRSGSIITAEARLRGLAAPHRADAAATAVGPIADEAPASSIAPIPERPLRQDGAG